jgi:hypothetical protein
MAKPGVGRWWPTLTLLTTACLIICIVAVQTPAQMPPSITRADVDQWLHQYSGAKPEFSPGDIITGSQVEKLRPFVPPGYFEQMNFPELRAEIIAPRNHAPRADYLACTEKYQSQVRLNADGTLANYVCGQPFPASAIRIDDRQAGAKAVQNLEYRWQNYGQMIVNTFYVWERFGGSHNGVAPAQLDLPPEDWTAGITFTTKMPGDVAQFFGGGGSFERTVSAFYQRIYLSHLAQLADKGGLFPVPDAKDFFWKEFNGLYSPFDVRGTVLIDYRYSDPNRADDAWAYDPKLRRVRRISVEVKSDSVAGTDQTYEDFYTFSGRPVRWNFKFLGWKDVLCVLDSKYDYAHLYGPNGFIPNDAWSLRRFAVVERIPKEPHHPYSSAVMFWDAENWHPWMMLAFDREKKLSKISVFQQRWSEDFKDWSEINHGVQATNPIGIQVFDLQKARATLFTNFGTSYPTVTADHVRRLYDISKLEEAHR